MFSPKSVAEFSAVLLLLAGVVSTAQGQSEAYRGVHDPVLIQQQDWYYVFSTGAGVPIRRSKDLRQWEVLGRVFAEDVPGWAKAEIPKAKHVWAPDIAHYKDRYLLYYSVSTMGSQRSCIGLATNQTLDPQSPQYKWVDQGKVIESFPDQMDYNTIDPNFTVDAKGEPYLVWGSFWGGIKLMKLNPDTCKPVPGDTTIHSLAARPGTTAIEAPFLVHKNGWYYLFVSLDQCCRGVASNYHIAVGRSREITGPYVDYGGRPMREGFATLVLTGHGTCRGPGHNGIMLGSKGDWLINHMYDAAAKGRPTMQIRRLIFAEDGWPVVDEPLSEQPSQYRKLEAADLMGMWLHTVNFNAGEYIELKRDGKMNAASERATWEFEEGKLLLSWPRRDAPGHVWRDVCYVAAEGNSYIGRNQKGDVIRGTRQP